MKTRIVKTKKFALILLSTLLLFATACRSQNIIKSSESFVAFDTMISISLYSNSEKRNLELIAQSKILCEEWENIFSRTAIQSETYRINHSAAGTYQVSEQFAALSSLSRDYAEQMDGLFDPTIGAVSSLWEFGGENPRPPEQSVLEQALPFVDYTKISVSGTEFRKNDAEIILDFGAIAKGYAGDRLAEFFQANETASGSIDFGGDVVLFGKKPDQSPWVIGVANPTQGERGIIATLSVSQGSVVTSGSYQRFFQYDEKIYHHILDPRTGSPVQGDLVFVTIVAKNGALAEALSTTCFVLGVEKGLAFLEESGLGEGVFYDTNGTFHSSNGLTGLTIIPKK